MKDLLATARRFLAVASLATEAACCFAAADGLALARQGFRGPSFIVLGYALTSGLTGAIFGSGLTPAVRARSIALVGLLFLALRFTPSIRSTRSTAEL